MKHYFKKLLKVLTIKTFSPSERLEIEVSKMKESSSKCDTAYYTSRGKEKAFIDRIKEVELYIKELSVKAKKLGDSDDILTLRIMKEIEVQNEQLVFLNKNLELSKKLTAKLYSQKVIIDSKISSHENSLTMLKSKEEFSNSIKEFQNIVGSDAKSYFEDIEKEININFNASEFRFEDMEHDEIPLSKLLEDSEDEKLKQFKKTL